MSFFLSSTLLTLLMSATPAVEHAMLSQPKTDAVTVAGCLQKGTNADAFTLMTDTKSYEVAGSPDLVKHIGHRIEVSGELTIDSRGDSKLDVKSVKMLATSCSRDLQ